MLIHTETRPSSSKGEASAARLVRGRGRPGGPGGPDRRAVVPVRARLAGTATPPRRPRSPSTGGKPGEPRAAWPARLHGERVHPVVEAAVVEIGARPSTTGAAPVGPPPARAPQARAVGRPQRVRAADRGRPSRPRPASHRPGVAGRRRSAELQISAPSAARNACSRRSCPPKYTTPALDARAVAGPPPRPSSTPPSRRPPAARHRPSLPPTQTTAGHHGRATEGPGARVPDQRAVGRPQRVQPQIAAAEVDHAPGPTGLISGPRPAAELHATAPSAARNAHSRSSYRRNRPSRRPSPGR